MVDLKKCWLSEKCNQKDCHGGYLNGCFCLRHYKLDSLYNLSLLSEAQRNHIVLKIDEDGTDYEEFKRLATIEKDIVNFIKEGKSLFIHSSQPGNGKSSWTIRLLESYFNHIWPSTDLVCRGLFISVPRFLLALKENISAKNEYVTFIKENIMNADIVVFDDIGAKVGTDFELNHLLSLIDGRIAAGKTNVYTSNLNQEGISEALGERLASRICQLSENIELHGADKRGLGGNR